MKTNFIILFLFASQNFLFAQWTPVGNQIWNNGPPVALAADTNYVYAGGGWFTTIGTDTVNQIAKWDGTSWTGLGTGVKNASGTINALCVYNGKLYAGGNIIMIGDTAVQSIAQWDGSAWLPVGAGVNNIVLSLCVHNGELYAGGDFDSAGTVAANRVAKWNGSTWSAVGNGINNGGVNALASFQGNLYAGGTFTLAGGNPANYIAKWDGSNWTSLGTGTDKWVDALAANKNFLFAGGAITNAGGINVNGIAQWDGNNWSALAPISWIPYCTGQLNALALCTDTINNLFVGFYQSCPYVFRYDGTNWYFVCSSGPNIALDWPASLILSKGELYATALIANVAKCSDTTGTAIGVNELNNTIKEITIIPNPLSDKSILYLNQNTSGEVSFYNVLGEKVFEKKFMQELPLNRNDFNHAGIYFYHVIIKTNSYRGKLIVK